MRRLSTIAALSLVACGHDNGAPGESQLLVPEDVEFGWDVSFNRRDDGRALLVPIDVMVYSPSGEPVEGADLVLTGTSGAWLARPEAILPLGADDPRGAWWDAWRDRYFAFGEDPVLVLEVETDGTGLARAWAFTDGFTPDGANGFVPAQVTVALGDTEESFLLVPR